MEIVKAPIYVKLTEEERNHLHQASLILNQLYEIANDNNYEYVSDTCGNGYDKYDIQSAECVLQIFAPAEKLEICN